MGAIAELQERDRQTKPLGADDEWTRSARYYNDQSRSLTRTLLQANGQGVPDDARPLEINLLRRLVEQLATIYDRPPTRWLTDASGERISEQDPRHLLMTRVLKDMRYDLALRTMDRWRAIYRQVAVRFYPSDALGRVVPRLFPPQCVLRDVSNEVPDSMDADKSFALLIRGGSGDAKVYEHWFRRDGDWWFQQIDNEDNIYAPPQRATYPLLPVVLVYDDYPAGQAWLSPHATRTSFLEKANLIANDLIELVRSQAHDQKVVTTNNTEDVPDEHGPGKVWALPRDATAAVLSSNPKIEASTEVLMAVLSLMLYSESLPLSMFNRDRTINTGAALKAEQAPLMARRSLQIPLAEADEADLYRRLRGVHNAHSRYATEVGGRWGAAPLDEETELNAEVAPVEIPTETADQLNAGGRSLALGVASTIDLIMEMRSVPRTSAIAIYERVARDRELYPTPVAPESLVQGPGVAGSAKPRSDAPSVLPVGRVDQGGKPSVVQALAAAGG